MLDASPHHSPDPFQSDFPSAKLAPLFAFGQVVSTPGAMELMLSVGADAFELLARHGRGDWSDMSREDAQANTSAIKDETRILSSYELPQGAGQVWIVTEADRSSTTLLLPDEY